MIEDMITCFTRVGGEEALWTALEEYVDVVGKGLESEVRSAG
jgi:hypothetical protein